MKSKRNKGRALGARALALASALALAAALAPAAASAADPAAPAEDSSGAATPLTVRYYEPAEASAQSDNVAFSVPSQVNFAAKADGTLVGPSKEATAVKNMSAFGVRVSSMLVGALGEWAVTDEAHVASVENGVYLHIGPAGDVLDASGYTSKAPVARPAAWNMGYMGAAGATSDSLPVSFSGGYGATTVDLTAEGGAEFARVGWYVTPGNYSAAESASHALSMPGTLDEETGAYAVEHGTLSFGADSKSVDGVAAGDTVTVTAAPDEGYELASVTVTKSSMGGESAGGPVPMMGIQSVEQVPVAVSGNKAVFTMPDSAVSVSVTMRIASAEPQEPAAPTYVTVSYNANSGEGALSAQKVRSGNAVIVKNAGDTVTKTGYVFVGWNTQADGTGISYAAGATVPAVIADMTLYAQWEVIRYTISWYNDNGTQLLAADYVEYDHTPAYTGEIPTKAATAEWTYAFANAWATVPNSEDALAQIPPATADVSYYAVFTQQRNSYTVTWKDHDGADLKTEEIEYGQTPSYGADPARASTDAEDFSFSEWRDTASGDGNVVSAVVGIVTYYARYVTSARVYAVVLDAQGADSEAGGTATVYEKYGVGWYLDAATSQRMTAEANGVTAPERSGYSFEGYYTGVEGSGMQVIGADGRLVDGASSELFKASTQASVPHVLYAKWENPAAALSWESSTDAELKALFDKYYAGSVSKESITSADGFQVGTVREVELTDGMKVSFRIMDTNDSARHKYTTATAGGESKPALFIVQTVDCLSELHSMNTTNSQTNGWPATAMRAYLNTNYSKANDGGVYGALLPDGFRSLLRQVTVGGSKDGSDSTQVTSKDWLFLPAISEVEALPEYNNTYNHEDYPQWSWYMAGGSKVKNVNNNANGWWFRSPASGTNSFRSIHATGLANTFFDTVHADVGLGVAPCGCI